MDFCRAAFQFRNPVRPSQSLKKAHPAAFCKICSLLKACRTNSTFGDIYDTSDRNIINAAVDDLEVGQHIFDFFPLIEIDAADYPVRKSGVDKFLLQRTGLGIGPVENGKITVICLLCPSLSLDIRNNSLCLFIFILILMKCDAHAFFIFRPEGLFLTAIIVTDHSIGRIQNGLGRPVVFLQLNHLGIRKMLLKIQNIADIGATELINGLVVIADHAKIAVLVCQHAYQLELDRVGILILIDHDITKPVLVKLQHIRCLLEKFYRLQKQVIKVHGLIMVESLLISRISVRDPQLAEITPGQLLVFLRPNHLIFCRRNFGQNGPLLHGLGIDLQLLADLPHNRLLIIRIIDRKTLIPADPVAKAPQHTDTGRMESADPDILSSEIHDRIHTLPHLSGRFIGKSNRKNIPGIDIAFLDQVSNPVRQNPGLSRTRTCKNKKRSVDMADRFLLGGI